MVSATHTTSDPPGGADGAHDTCPTTSRSRDTTPLADVSRASPARARLRPACSGGLGTRSRRCGPASPGGSGGPVAIAAGGDTVGPDLGADVPHRVGLPHPPCTDPRTERGQPSARSDPGGPAHAAVAAAVAAPGAGSAGQPVAPGGGETPGHAPSRAMDLGGRRPRLQEL